MAEHHGPWPGPNPLKDIFVGLSIGLVFAVAFKSWQIKDKASACASTRSTSARAACGGGARGQAEEGGTCRGGEARQRRTPSDEEEAEAAAA